MMAPAFGRIARLVRLERIRQLRMAALAGKRALALQRHQEQFERARLVLNERDVEHRLAELALVVEIFDEIGLVDDVDQVARFGHAPVHAAQAGAELDVFADLRVVQLADVGVAALVVARIDAAEDFADDALAPVVPFVEDLGRRRGGWRPRGAVGVIEPAALGLDAQVEIDGGR